MSKQILILLIVFGVSFKKSNGQNIYCEIVKKSVNTEYFKKEFSLYKLDSVILIYDKKQILYECQKFTENSKLFKISTDTINDLNPDKYSKYKPENLIVLYDFSNNKNYYTLNFWRPYTGANVVLTYKIKKGKVKLISHKTGTF